MALKVNDWRWLVWWKIDEKALAREVAEGDNRPVWKTARGITLGLSLFNIALICAVVFFDPVAEYSLAESGLLLLLGGFIFMGQRWAMIAGMVFWTAVKILALRQFGLSGTLGVFTGWTLYMHAAYAAFRVEQARAKLTAVPLPLVSGG